MTNQQNKVRHNENQPNEVPKNERKNLIPEFISELIWNIKKTPDFESFCKKILEGKNEKINDEVRSQMDLFQAQNYEKYGNVNIKNISNYLLLSEIIKNGGVEPGSLRDKINKIFDTLYLLDDEKKLQIKLAIEKKNLAQLKNLGEIELERDEFLKDVFGGQIPNKKEAENVFGAIEGIKFEELNPELQKDIKDFYNCGHESEKIIKLIKDTLDKKQKKELIKTFIPMISLAKLEKFGVYDEEETKKHLRNELKKYFTQNGQADPGEEDYKKLLGFIKKENILKPSSEILDSIDDENILNKIIEDDKLHNIFTEARRQAQEAEENKKIKNKEEFFKKVEELKLNDKIVGLKNIQDGDIIKGVFVDPIKNQTSVLYVRINKIHDTDGIFCTDLSTVGGVLDIPKEEGSQWDYDGLINFCNNLHSGGVIKYDVFEKLKKDGAIQSFVPENEIENIEDLKKHINVIDPDGAKYGLGIGTVFEFEGGQDDEVAVGKITKITNNSITVVSDGEETFSFYEFLSAFRGNHSKRIAIINNTSDLLKSFQFHDDTKEWFKDIIFDKDKNKFLPKGQDHNDKHPGITCFIGKDKKAIKITKYGENQIEVIVGEWKEKKEETDKKDTKNIKYSIDNQKRVKMTPEAFYAYVTKNKLKPNLEENSFKVKEVNIQSKIKDNFSLAAFLSGLQNFATLSIGIKQAFDSLKDSFKEQSDLQAAKFALSCGKILPEGLQTDLKSKVESVEQGKCNDKIGRLEKMGPDRALAHVYNRLQVSNLPQYETEAMLIFVIKKNGCLYPGKDLTKCSSDFLWYKRLAGISLSTKSLVGDPVYDKYVKDKSLNNLPIIEEELIIKLLMDQEGGKSKHYNIKRRSSIVKEFGKEWNANRGGIKEGGKTECKGRSYTTEGKIDYCLSQFKDGMDMMGFGALSEVFNRGGTVLEMNKIPFILAMSGITKVWPQGELTELQSLGWENSFPILTYAASPGTSDDFEKIVIKLAKTKILSKEAGEAAEAIRKKSSRLDKIIAAGEFWDKYGEKLASYLTGNNFEMFTLQEEDLDMTKIMETSKTTANSHKFSDSLAGNGIYDPGHSNLFLASGSGYLGKALKSLNRTDSNMKDGVEKIVFDTYLTELDNIKNIVGSDENDTKQKQKKLFKFYNGEMVKFLKSRQIYKNNIIDRAIDWGYKLISKGLWIPTIEQARQFTEEDIYLKCDSVFEKAFNNFSSGNASETISATQKNNTVRAREVRDLTPEEIQRKKEQERQAAVSANILSNNIKNGDLDD